jgi:Ca2+-binding protein (EF-Hand superfamily)
MTNKEEIKLLLEDENILKELVETAFKKVDTDQSGTIDKKELKALMDEASKGKFEPLTEDELNEIYAGLDKNNDGQITCDEFAVLIKTVLEAMME